MAQVNARRWNASSPTTPSITTISRPLLYSNDTSMGLFVIFIPKPLLLSLAWPEAGVDVIYKKKKKEKKKKQID